MGTDGRFRTALSIYLFADVRTAEFGFRSQVPRSEVRKRPTPADAEIYCERAMSRIRHCVDCPNCRTLYLLGSSPYGNGARLVGMPPTLPQEYALYCPCRHSGFPMRWKWSEVKACRVTMAAHRRGYGAHGEIVTLCEPQNSGDGTVPRGSV